MVKLWFSNQNIIEQGCSINHLLLVKAEDIDNYPTRQIDLDVKNGNEGGHLILKGNWLSSFFWDNCNWFHVYMKVVQVYQTHFTPKVSNWLSFSKAIFQRNIKRLLSLSYRYNPNLILDINVDQRLIKEGMITFIYYTIYSQGCIISKYQYWNKNINK